MSLLRLERLDLVEIVEIMPCAIQAVSQSQITKISRDHCEICIVNGT